MTTLTIESLSDLTNVEVLLGILDKMNVIANVKDAIDVIDQITNPCDEDRPKLEWYAELLEKELNC